MNKKLSWFLLIIILIAFALRLHNLTYHSLWFDEAISIHWARQTVPRILEVGFTLVEDRLPPLYYLTLKGWGGLFGFSETSVRSLSVIWGVLLIPVVTGIATLLFNRRVAVFAALLVALNPFLIWYSQEARMYAPAVFFSTLTVWTWLWFIKITSGQNREPVADQHSPSFITHQTVETPPFTIHNSQFTIHNSQFIILFILFAVLGLYTHLYTGFLLPALGLWLMISYPRAWRLWLIFAVSGLAVSAAFAPLALTIWRFSGEAAPGDPLNHLGQRTWWLLQSFIVWKAPLSPALQIVISGIVILFAILAYLKPKNYRQLQITNGKSEIANPRLLITFLFVTPFVIANLLLVRNHLTFFGERYFIVMIPWLLLLAAIGTENLGGWLGQVAKTRGRGLRAILYLPHVVLLLATILPLPGQWSIPAAKEAWRQSAAYLTTHAKANHGILIHPDWVRYPFQFYFQGPGQTYAAFSTVTPGTSLDGPLQGVVGEHPVIWLIQSHLDGPDPQRLVEQWFAARYPLATELYPPGITLKGFVPGYRLDHLPPEATPVDLQFENGLRLIGYQAETSVSAADELFHPPSGWLHVILYWRADHPLAQNAAPFVHLVGPEGIWGASLERPNDALKLYPPTQWPSTPGSQQVIRHDVDVNLNPATPPGRYQLAVGLDGSETRYILARVEVQ
ncbi:MAG: glycosyltransferase family 39 protein [Anaerolineae bacterium]|nr:glycosyltransferase family 39 protein [Anaerolineae bacterium]